MAELHITESELARDVHAVLEKVRRGAEVVIEQDRRREMFEIIADLEASGASARLDEDFAPTWRRP